MDSSSRLATRELLDRLAKLREELRVERERLNAEREKARELVTLARKTRLAR